MIRKVLRRAGFAIVSAIFVCGAASSGSADSITIPARAMEVGKWAEGLTFDGASIWVAESGQKSIAQVDPATGKVLRRVLVGRLPVGMATYTDGAVYSLVQTDKILWQQFPAQSGGKPFTGLPGCPTALTAGDQAMWILSEPNCSSEDSFLIRLDPRTGARTNSGSLGDSAQAILATPGKIFVAATRSPNLAIVNQKSMAIQKADIPGVELWALAANDSQLFAGGLRGEQGVLVAIDPASGRELQRQSVGQKIFQIAADKTHVVALSNEGSAYVFSAATLQLQRVVTVTPPYGGISAGGGVRDARIIGDILYITSGQQFGENGALLALGNWRPAAAAPTPAAKATPAASAPVVAN
jgi:outer membrane protein assembly factor BamB